MVALLRHASLAARRPLFRPPPSLHCLLPGNTVSASAELRSEVKIFNRQGVLSLLVQAKGQPNGIHLGPQNVPHCIERLDQSPPGHPAVDRSSALLGLLGHLHAGATKKCRVWALSRRLSLGFSSDDSTMEKGVERRPLPYDELSPGVV